MWEVVLLDQTQVDQLQAGDRILTDVKPSAWVMGVYDPLGLISPALIHGKLLLEEFVWGGSSGGLGTPTCLPRRKCAGQHGFAASSSQLKPHSPDLQNLTTP